MKSSNGLRVTCRVKSKYQLRVRKKTVIHVIPTSHENHVKPSKLTNQQNNVILDNIVLLSLYDTGEYGYFSTKKVWTKYL